jgi:sugar phosphate isomerase/epimerase
MPRLFSLAYLTAPLPAPDAVRLAADAGYDMIGIRIAPAARGSVIFSDLIGDRGLLAQTKAALADTDLEVFDVEVVRITEAFAAADLEPFVATAAELGGRTMLTIGEDPDKARLTDSFAAFCELAGRYDLTASLEFLPWTPVRTAEDAVRIAAGANHAAARVLPDALHAARSGTTAEAIAAIPRALLSYTQLCDAPAQAPATTEGLIDAARHARLAPGEGQLDLEGFLRAQPGNLPISLEVPNVERSAAMGARAWAAHVLKAGKAIADRVG